MVFWKSSKASAETAKERLKLVLTYEQGERPDSRFDSEGEDILLLERIKKDILDVVQRHVDVSESNIEIKLDESKPKAKTLEVNVELPHNS